MAVNKKYQDGVVAGAAIRDGKGRRIDKALDEKANLSGFHGAMVAGGAVSLVPEKAEDAMPAYTENLPAARMVGDGGALTDQTFAQGVYPHMPHVPDDAKGKRSSLSFERVEGECLGCNQMVNIAYNRTVNGLTFTDNGDDTVTINGIATSKNSITFYTFNDKSKRVFIPAKCLTGGSPSTYKITFDFIDNDLDIGDRGFIGKPTGSYFTLFHVNGQVFNNVKMIKPSFMSLDILFPTPSGQAFVSKLGNNQSSALAVCNKLGYASVITYDE